MDHLDITKIEELDDQIGLGVAIEAHSGPTNKVVEEVIIIEAQFEKPTIESIILQDLALKPPVRVGLLVGTPDVGIEDFKTKRVRQRQWRVAWGFLAFCRKIVLVPL